MSDVKINEKDDAKPPRGTVRITVPVTEEEVQAMRSYLGFDPEDVATHPSRQASSEA
jgi:hypothetical protein